MKLSIGTRLAGASRLPIPDASLLELRARAVVWLREPVRAAMAVVDGERKAREVEASK